MSRAALRGLVAFAVLVVVAAAAWLLRGAERPGGPVSAAATLVPAASPAALWSAPLGDVADQLETVAGRLEGSGGLAEAAGVWLGIGRLDRAHLAHAGLRPEAGVAACVFDGALWLLVPAVSDQGAALLAKILGHRGVTLVARGERRWRSNDPSVHVWHEADGTWVARALLPTRWAAQIGAAPGASNTPGSAVAPAPAAADGAAAAAQANVVRPGETRGDAAEGDAAADAALQRWRDAPRRSDAAGPALQGVWTLATGDGLRPALRSALGPATLLFGRAVDAIEAVELQVTGLADAPHIALRARLPAGLAKELASYHQGFGAEAAGVDLGALLPDEVALQLRGRLNPALLDMIPSMLRDRLLPRELLGRLDPALATVDARALVIEAWNGELGGGLLGVADDLVPSPRLLAEPSGLLGSLGGYVVIGLRDQAARERLQSAIEQAFAAAGSPGEPVRLGAGSGTTWPKASPPRTLLGAGHGLLLLMGDGELARWQRVADKKLPSAADVAAGALERDLLVGRDAWWAAGIAVGRIVRAARRRGIPEHFVRMIASIAAANARLDLDDRGIAVDLVVRPRIDKDAP